MAWGGPPAVNHSSTRPSYVSGVYERHTFAAQALRCSKTPAATWDVDNLKRLSINTRPDLHHRFKISCPRASLAMTAKVLSFIERRTAELEKS
jgi:hypothetical protein